MVAFFHAVEPEDDEEDYVGGDEWQVEEQYTREDGHSRQRRQLLGYNTQRLVLMNISIFSPSTLNPPKKLYSTISAWLSGRPPVNSAS